MKGKTLAKMYEYENLVYYDNALYEHNHDHKDENHRYLLGNEKLVDVKSHNKSMLKVLMNSIVSKH